jgi:acyl carrier protein
LDALAHMRRSQGAAALSVNWGPWDEVGMAASLGDEGRRRRASYGMGVLARDEAFSALSDLLADGSAQAAVVRVEWKGYSAATQGPRLLSAIVPGPVAAPDASLRAPLLAQLQSGTPRQRETLITTFVREGIRRVIGHPLSATINPNQPLSELGLDSLMAVELRNVLGEGLGRSLPVTLMFDYPTLQDLERYLIAELTSNERNASAPSEISGPATGYGSELPVNLDVLSREAVEALLDERLAKLEGRIEE